MTARRMGAPAAVQDLDGCSEEVRVTAAWGDVVAHQPRVFRVTPRGAVLVPEPMPAGRPARVLGGLEAVEARVSRALRDVEARSRREGPLFEARHHVAALRYAELVEDVGRGRVKCSNLEASGGGGGLGVTDAMIARLQALRRMHGRLAECRGLAARGALAAPNRRSIPARDLLDAVVVDRVPLGDVLAAFGWPRESRHARRLHAALVEGLEAIYGV